MGHSIYRQLEGTIRFAFFDLHNNYMSVTLSQKQLDEYRDALDMFSTTPLRKANDANSADEPGRTSTPE